MILRMVHVRLAACFAVFVCSSLTLAQPDKGSSSIDVLAATQDALPQIIERNERSIVSIARVRPERRGGPLAMGGDRFDVQINPQARSVPTDPDFVPNEFATGVVIAAEGLVLTNYHVLEDDSEYYVTTVGGQVYPARVHAADPRSDLAVLRVEATDLVPIKLGDSGKLQRGHFVISLGNPYAIARDGEVSASLGIVANLDRKSPAATVGDSRPDKTKLHQFGGLIQTDARLSLGTSGGALLNLKGEMVGLTTAIAAHSGYDQAAGYAIPVDDTFRRVVAALKEGREVQYGLLGVRPENLSLAERQRGAQGVRISHVQLGTPAYQAGVGPGDVIESVNGQSIADADGLMLAVGKLDVESRVRLSVSRYGRSFQTTAKLIKFPVQGKKVFTPPPYWRGMRVDYTTDEFMRPFQRNPHRQQALVSGCVSVSDVESEGPAWHVGVRSGALISHVNDKHVTSPREFYAAAAAAAGETVRLRLAGISPGDPPYLDIGP